MALRSNTNRMSRILVCAAAFAATAMAVYLVGNNSTQEPEPLYTARATVICRAAPAAITGSSPGPIGLDRQTIRRQIVDDDNLRWAIGGSPSASSKELARMRRGLRITTTGGGSPEPLEIGIAFTGPDPNEASGLVDRLAEHFGEQQRARVEQPARDAYLQARNAAAAARARWVAARTRLDAMLNHHFKELSADASRLQAWENAQAQTAPPAKASRFVAAPPVPLRIARPARGPVDNPDWLDLSAQIEQLRQRRTQLLADRTPLHPSIRAIDGQIADLEGRIAEVPRQTELDEKPLSGETAGRPDPGGLPPLPPAEEQLEHPYVETPLVETHHIRAEPSGPIASTESVEAGGETYRKRREAVRLARQQYERLAAKARAAWAAQFRVPTISVKPSGGSELVGREKEPAELPLVALVAGLAAALSTAMILPGGGQPLLTTVGQVERCLRVPVLGKIDGPGAVSASATAPGARSGQGTSRTLFQVVLVTLCLGTLAIALLSYYLGR